VVFVTSHFQKPQSVVITPPKTGKNLTCHHKIAPHEERVFRRKIMSNARAVLVAREEAEAAVAEFLEMRAAILGRLTPEALRCVPAILERHLIERNTVTKSAKLE
jgi:hypothetical protein